MRTTIQLVPISLLSFLVVASMAMAAGNVHAAPSKESIKIDSPTKKTKKKPKRKLKPPPAGRTASSKISSVVVTPGVNIKTERLLLTGKQFSPLKLSTERLSFTGKRFRPVDVKTKDLYFTGKAAN